MLDMIMNEEIPSHASNLETVLANEIAEEAGVKAYIYDAVSAVGSEVSGDDGISRVQENLPCFERKPSRGNALCRVYR